MSFGALRFSFLEIFSSGITSLSNLYPKEKIMELYLLLSFVLLYVVTSVFTARSIRYKIWTVSFIIAFCVTAAAIGFLRVTRQDVMMSASQLNWYYVLYLFGSISVVLGAINLWMYRRPLWHILFDGEEDEEETASVK